MAQKSALVTGASSGIGREFAMQLASLGYQVTAVARREDRLQQLMEELPGGGHGYRIADLATTEGVASIVDTLAGQRYHLLVNNAGYSVFDPFYTSDLESQQKILDVNCVALVSLSHAFLQQAKDTDALINLGSIVSFLPTPTQPIYSASKAFIAAFSECLWVEHRERGVYVMALCPGVTQTEFISSATGGEADGDSIPGFLIQTSEAVVAEAMTALSKRKKAVVVTGWVNRLMLLMPRLLTRHWLIKVLAVLGDPERALHSK